MALPRMQFRMEELEYIKYRGGREDKVSLSTGLYSTNCNTEAEALKTAATHIEVSTHASRCSPCVVLLLDALPILQALQSNRDTDHNNDVLPPSSRRLDFPPDEGEQEKEKGGEEDEEKEEEKDDKEEEDTWSFQKLVCAPLLGSRSKLFYSEPCSLRSDFHSFKLVAMLNFLLTCLWHLRVCS